MSDNYNENVLSIRIAADGFYFSTPAYQVRNECRSDNRVEELAALVGSHLRADTAALEVRSETPKFALFPIDYKEAETQFALLHELLPDEKILRHDVPEVGIKVLFAMETDIWRYFSSTFSNVSFLPEVADLLRTDGSCGATLALRTFPGRVYAVLSVDGKIVLANAFACEGDEAFVYNVANIFVQFSLSRTETSISLSEFGAMRGEKRKLLQKYFEKIK